MPPRIDLTGKVIGMLRVISYSHSHVQPSKQKRAMWNVICACGTKKKVSTANLSGGTISCGCYANKRRKSGFNKKPKGQASLNYKYISYKFRAKYLDKDFSLSKEEFKAIIDKNCYYCGAEPMMHHTGRSPNGQYISNGIDRIDSNIGYVLNNCVPCCKICNMMKNKLSLNDFIRHIYEIYKHSLYKKDILEG